MLPVIVLFLTVSAPWWISLSPKFWMPPESPPPSSAWFPETVERTTSIVPPLFDNPPPEQAEPPVTVTSVSVRSPELRTSPPKQPLFSSAVPPLQREALDRDRRRRRRDVEHAVARRSRGSSSSARRRP